MRLRTWAVLLLPFGMLLAPAARADDVLHVGSATLDPPTVISLGVRLGISGDDDHDAQVTVRYRPVGAPAWRAGMALFRVHPEDVVGRTVSEEFAGSLFELRPGTSYEIELHATD